LKTLVQQISVKTMITIATVLNHRPPHKRGGFERWDNRCSYAVSPLLRVSLSRVNEIVHDKRSISADAPLRPGTYFGLPAQFWMNLQADYDLRRARTNNSLKRIKPRPAA
jgi:addiction module HigA family antidote